MLLDGCGQNDRRQFMAWVQASVPLWLWSKAGSGKTHMFRQIAELLAIKPWVLSCDETLIVSKLMGFRNAGNGGFAEGLVQALRKAAGDSVLVSPRASYNGVKALRPTFASN